MLEIHLKQGYYLFYPFLLKSVPLKSCRCCHQRYLGRNISLRSLLIHPYIYQSVCRTNFNSQTSVSAISLVSLVILQAISLCWIKCLHIFISVKAYLTPSHPKADSALTNLSLVIKFQPLTSHSECFSI